MRRLSEATGLPTGTSPSPPPPFPPRSGFTARLRQHSYSGSNAGLHGLHMHSSSNGGMRLMRLCLQLAAICGCLLLGFHLSRQAAYFLARQKGGGELPQDVSQDLEVGRTERVATRLELFGARDWLENSEEFSQVLRAQELAARAAGRLLKGGKRKTVLVVTPTFARTFQAMYLGGLAASLRLVASPLLWIVVEAGGKTAETESILVASGVDRFVHLAFGERHPNPLDWSERSEMEVRMRIRALLHIRRTRLDGVVVFCDDSNVHTLAFFEEAQNVEWFGAAPVGFLVQEGYVDAFSSGATAPENAGLAVKSRAKPKQKTRFRRVPLQSPVCATNSTSLIGWHVFPHRPRDLDRHGPPIRPVDEQGSLEWGGFVINARLLWDEDLLVKRPAWVRAWHEWSGEIVGEEDLLGEWTTGDAHILTRMIRNDAHVEPLGDCGRKALVWWMHAEARFTSVFPPMWTLKDMPPTKEIVAPRLKLKVDDAQGDIIEEDGAGVVQDEQETDSAEQVGARKSLSGWIPPARRSMIQLDLLGDRLDMGNPAKTTTSTNELAMEGEEESFLATAEGNELELLSEQR